MKINKQKFSATVFAGFVICLPLVAWAQSLVPCENNCDFDQLMVLANNIIGFLLYSVAVPLAALGFMVVGARLVFYQNKESAWTEAKKSFEYIGTGFFIILGAFLLIKFVLYQFLNTDAGFILFLAE